MSDGKLWDPRAVNSLADVARVLGEVAGVGIPITKVPTIDVSRAPRFRRDYTPLELYEMADNAAAGTPPPFSPARLWIAQAQMSGDFERAAALTREVKELAVDLRRMARAAEKAERRAKRGGHIHICKDWPNGCGPDGMGPCVCKCGARAIMSETSTRIVWRRKDGTEDPFPDPREADHPKARQFDGGR